MSDNYCTHCSVHEICETRQPGEPITKDLVNPFIKCLEDWLLEFKDRDIRIFYADDDTLIEITDDQLKVLLESTNTENLPKINLDTVSSDIGGIPLINIPGDTEFEKAKYLVNYRRSSETGETLLVASLDIGSDKNFEFYL